MLVSSPPSRSRNISRGGEHTFTVLLELCSDSMLPEQLRILGSQSWTFSSWQDDSHWEEKIYYQFDKAVADGCDLLGIESAISRLLVQYLMSAAIRYLWYCHCYSLINSRARPRFQRDDGSLSWFGRPIINAESPYPQRGHLKWIIPSRDNSLLFTNVNEREALCCRPPVYSFVYLLKKLAVLENVKLNQIFWFLQVKSLTLATYVERISLTVLILRSTKRCCSDSASLDSSHLSETNY